MQTPPIVRPSLFQPTPPPQPGNGVDLLRDGRTDTYWQSDGNPPHLINIMFQRKVCCGREGVVVGAGREGGPREQKHNAHSSPPPSSSNR